MALFGTAANVSMTTTPALVNALLDRIQLTGAFVFSGALAIVSVFMALRVRQKQGPVKHNSVWVDLLNVAKKLRIPLAAAALFGISFGAFFQFLPLLAERRDIGPAGLVFTVYGVSLILTRLVTAKGRLLDRHNPGRILLVAFLILGMGLCGFAFVGSHHQLLTAAVIFAIGAGTLHPLLIAIHVGRVSADERGRASAVFYFGFDLGIGMGAWIFSPIFQWYGMTGLFVLAAIAAVMGTIPAFLMTDHTPSI
jgi:predicted MFS family arabinose efflux permease